MPWPFVQGEFTWPPKLITSWKAQLAEGAAGLFGGPPAAGAAPAVDLKSPRAKIGDLALEYDFLPGALGKAARRGKVFAERLWRSVKYEDVHLHAYASAGEARAGLDRYLNFYNGRRPHSSLPARPAKPALPRPQGLPPPENLPARSWSSAVQRCQKSVNQD